MSLTRIAPPTLTRAASAVRDWPVRSQQVARRNALISSTELTARRIERDEVEDFLHHAVDRWTHRLVPTIRPVHGPLTVTDLALRTAL